jgi:LacI family transcriptional regulator
MGKKPTSHDVARLAGVSQSTVSMVLNQKTGASFSRETIDRVLDAARKLEYRIPAVNVPRLAHNRT